MILFFMVDKRVEGDWDTLSPGKWHNFYSVFGDSSQEEATKWVRENNPEATILFRYM